MKTLIPILILWFCLPVMAQRAPMVVTVDTIADLVALNPVPYSSGNKVTVQVLGYHEPNDGGGGFFNSQISATSTNLGIVLASVRSGYQWHRLDWDKSVKAFGVRADAYYNTTTAAWDGTDDTIALQSAIDYAIESRTYRVVLAPSPMLIQPPAGWTENYILILSYNSYLSADPGLLRKSVTYPAGRSDGWTRYQTRTMELVGTPPNEVNPPTAKEGPDRLIGSWLVVKGAPSMYAVSTGGFMYGTTLKDFGIIGEGSSLTGGGVQIEVSSSNTKLDSLNISSVNIGVGVGTYALEGANDLHSDWAYLDRCVIQFVDTCVRVGAQNSYMTRITQPKFRGRVGIDNRTNPYGVTSFKINPQTTVNGGYIQADHGVIDGGNYYVSGVVTNVSGQSITIDASSLQKISSVFGAATSTTNVATLSDISTNMLISVYGNTILGKPRNEVPVINRVTNIVDSTLTLRGYVNADNIVGQRFIVLNPAVGLIGSNYRVFGTEFEYQQVNTRGMPVMLLWNESYFSTDILDGIRFQNFPTTITNQTEMEMIWPRVYTETHNESFAGTLEFRAGIVRAAHFVAQVGVLPVRFQSMSFGTWPMFINHNGSDAPGVALDNCEFSSVTRDNTLANKLPPIWTDRGIFQKAVLSNGIMATPLYFTEIVPAMTGTSDLLVRPHQSPTIAQRQLGAVSTTLPRYDGYYDASTITSTFTNNVAVDPYKITMDDFSTLYVGRVVTLSGAGVSGVSLMARVTDIGYDTNGFRFARINLPAQTSVIGGTIANTTTALRGFGRQADFAGTRPNSIYQSVGDVLWKGNAVAGDPIGWVIPKTGSTDQGLQIGIAGARPLDYMLPISTTISDPPTQAEVEEIRDGYNTLLAALQSNYLMMPATNSYGYTNVLILAAGSNISIHDNRLAQDWVLREERAGVNTSSLYWSVDSVGPVVLVAGANLFSTGTNVLSMNSYRSFASLTNTVGEANSPAWDYTKPAFDFRDTSVERWMSRSSVINVGVGAFQTYQIRGLQLYGSLGDGAIVKNNRDGVNDMQIRISAAGSPYLRYHDAGGAVSDFTFDRVRLTLNRPTMLTFHIKRASHADLFVDGNFMQSIPLFGINAIDIDSTDHGFATDAGQALKFFVTGLTALSGNIWF